MWQPANTDALLYLIYALLGVAIIATLLGAIFQFGATFKDSPAAALKSLLGLILLVAVLVISWAIGSDQQLVIPGYDGTDNVPFWLKLTDMFLFSIYFLLGFAIVAIIASSIWKKLS
jgi:ABC-type Fe3+ transport system permease subunit